MGQVYLDHLKGSPEGRQAPRLPEGEAGQAKCPVGLRGNRGMHGQPGCPTADPLPSDETAPPSASFSAVTLSVLVTHVGQTV